VITVGVKKIVKLQIGLSFRIIISDRGSLFQITLFRREISFEIRLIKIFHLSGPIQELVTHPLCHPLHLNKTPFAELFAQRFSFEKPRRVWPSSAK
jgi:hypothetical protein